ncbi:DUF3597 domain-containing protein [Orbus mooreae]|uniref:DUF3597 domain-containing protein n=1 Tax=Orbus mooreae TaxID=3074107 RepID=UPI00370D4B42
MGILSSIFSKIISSASAAGVVGQVAEKMKAKDAQQNTTAATSTVDSSIETTSNSFEKIDVAAILNELAQKNSQQLNWKTSIVDLLKLLGLDSSLDARKKLAAELNYTGNTDDSAAMNIWLHKMVMQKIVDNGGNVNDLF